MDKTLKFLLGILFGGFVGVVAASLLTPKSGDAIRGDIRNGFEEIKLDYEAGKKKTREELEAEYRRRCGE